MSKKNEKRKRNLEREKRNVKTAIVPLVAGVIFLVLGIIGLIQNSGYLKEYETSEDIRRIEATVTDAKLKDDKDTEKTWYVHLEFDVDGKTYNDETTLYTHSVHVGDPVNIEIYRRPNGEYTIPVISSSADLAVKNLLNYIALAVGAVLLMCSAVYLVLTARKIKEIKSKIQPD